MKDTDSTETLLEVAPTEEDTMEKLNKALYEAHINCLDAFLESQRILDRSIHFAHGSKLKKGYTYL